MPKHTPCSHSSWELFDEVLVKMETKEHLEDDGMKRLIELITNERDDKKV